jgi:hypothetical protein
MTPEREPDRGSSDRTDKFVLAEYTAVRDEIKWVIGQVDALETTALLSSGALWAWALAPARTATPAYPAIMWLPFALSVLFLIKRSSLRRSLRQCAVFSLKVEDTSIYRKICVTSRVLRESTIFESGKSGFGRRWLDLTSSSLC